MKLDGFLLAMLSAVVLALLWPGVGANNGPLHLGVVTQAGIALVFFAHGVMLAPQAVRAGVAKWRLHLFVQLCTFVAFPILGALLYVSTRGVLTDELRLGFFLLCAMSSTISSSVAMTAMARGDVVSAVFNATISGLIGMVVTPFLMQWVAAQSGAAPSLGATILGILLTLALPFGLGQLLRPLLQPFLQPHKALINKVDRGVIVLIVYSSFCESTASGVWASFSWQQLLLTAALALVLLAIMLQVTRSSARALGFSREEEIAAVFCGSKKSLASGAPIARILFGSHPGLGLIMLPLMLYHQIQLLVCTVLARRYAQSAPIAAAEPVSTK
ncbi:MAG: bile acid:sodium symporter family protein [Steroidobacteraceae bacterium]